MDEIVLVMAEWNRLHNPDKDDKAEILDDPLAFLGEGGEIIG